jgi:membrane protease YdiL (CAAX protease family)
MSPGGLVNLIAVVIWAVWLYGTLALSERRSGYIIILLASLLMMVVPVIHLRGPGIGFGTHRSGGLFFIWTILALGVTALFSIILSVRGLWNGQSRRSSRP